jgi:hypothetical protein
MTSGLPTVLLHGDILRVGPLQFEMLIEQTPGKAKRPKVADIKEAVARTAEGSGINSTSDLGDVTQWLEEADTHERSRRTTDPETRQFRLDDTLVPASSETPSAGIDPKAAAGTLKRPAKQVPGKLPPRPATSKADSREAAADMLKKFFNRR